MRDNYSKISPIDIIVIFIFALYYIIPVMSKEYNFMLILTLGVIYIAYCIIGNGKKISNEIVKYIVIITLIALLYLLLNDTATIDASASSAKTKRFFSKFFQLFMMFIPVLFLTRMVMFASLRQKKIVLAVSFLLYGYVIMQTMEQLLINPNITRDWNEFAESSSRNVANYYFVYAIPILIVLCILFLTKTRSILAKVFMAGLIVYQMNFLLKAQYTLSVFITIVGGAYAINISTKKSRNKNILIFVSVCLIILSPWIIKLAASNVSSEQISIRLHEISNFLLGEGDMGYNMNGRMTLYIDTIRAFLHSPIWGNESLDFDGHATFLTVLSDLGLLGGIPFYYLYFSTNNRVKYLIEDKKGRFRPFFFMLILMGFTNPIHSALPLMYAIWFVAPLTLSLYKDSRELL